MASRLDPEAVLCDFEKRLRKASEMRKCRLRSGLLSVCLRIPRKMFRRAADMATKLADYKAIRGYLTPPTW
jgi:hypothetical protein